MIGANVQEKLYAFHGALDDVRVYARALSDAEVARLYSD